MSDDFLNALRQEPSPEFAHALKARLRKLDAPALRLAPRAARWAALAASLALVSFAFTFPAVRAGAQAFLDLFRVSSFAGVAFDPQRLASLGSSNLDWPQIVGEQFEVLKEPAPAVSYASPAEAGAAAGIRIYQPTWLPRGLELTSTEVAGESAMRFTASTAKLQLLLDTLGIDDVVVPQGVDGQQASLRVAPTVTMIYTHDALSVHLVQAKSPDVSFPAGLDLPVLAEIGLRILGLDRKEAYRIAQTIDWRTTLLVPVPLNAASFHQVDVQGQSALVIESARGFRENPIQDEDEGPGGSVLMWSAQGNVYALLGPLPPDELVQMAQTMQ